MATSNAEDIGAITKLRQDHELLSSAAIYLVASLIAYTWFAGPVGPYTVHSQVAIIGLACGALMFIPLLMGVISKSEYEIEAREAAEKKEAARQENIAKKEEASKKS